MVATAAPEALLTVSKWRYNWTRVVSQPTSTQSSFIKIHTLKIQKNKDVRILVSLSVEMNIPPLVVTDEHIDTQTQVAYPSPLGWSPFPKVLPEKGLWRSAYFHWWCTVFHLKMFKLLLFLWDHSQWLWPLVSLPHCIHPAPDTELERWSSDYRHVCTFPSLGFLNYWSWQQVRVVFWAGDRSVHVCISILAHPSVAVQIEKLPLPNFIWKWTSLPPLLFYVCKSIVGQVWASGMHFRLWGCWLSVVLENEFMALYVGTSLV